MTASDVALTKAAITSQTAAKACAKGSAGPEDDDDLERAGSGQPSDQTTEFLRARVQWASGLLQDIAQGKAASEYDKFQPAVLNSAQALAFVNVSKGGFLTTFGKGSGFVIKKLSQDLHGNSTWSRPLFFSVSQFGLGLSVGYQHCQSVLALLTESALEVFKGGTTSLGTDLGSFSTDGAIMGMSGGAALGHSQHLGIAVDQNRPIFCYSKVDGAFLELSLHGSTISPDHTTNDKLYGHGYDPDAVLNSNSTRMPELLPLGTLIVRYGSASLRSH